ncbi:glycosyltransferase [Microbaculum marinum]|uniref:Glycosyltransferase n=1 Tax=Microbaculum marinum TaxID=1764581 RepID=A0AAW9RMN6_9HYPH
MLSKLRNAPTYVRKYGLSAALRRSVAEVVGSPPPGHRGVVVEFYDAIFGHETGTGDPEAAAAPADSVTWVIPNFSPNSGGHINILRMVYGLEKLGFTNQTVVVQEPHHWPSADAALQAIRQHFFPLQHLKVVLGCDAIPPSRFLVATGWQTAYWVAKNRDAAHRIYFVQDFEPDFYATGAEHIFAEDTYRLGMFGMTAGDWLKEKLARDYGMPTAAFSFSFDRETYYRVPKRPKAKKQVFFYARPSTPRRAFEMGIMALRDVCAARDDVEVVLAGWNLRDYHIPFPHVDAKQLPVSRLADLYSQCDAGLVLSLTNLSLLPLEMMACGCPVVINRGPNNDWLVGDDVAAKCDLTIASIAQTVLKTLEGGRPVETMVERALDFANRTTWDDQARKMADTLKAIDRSAAPASRSAAG